MRYSEYRDAIAEALQDEPTGLTWVELKAKLALPYKRPCPTWTKQLEQDIGLERTKGGGRALYWQLRR